MSDKWGVCVLSFLLQAAGRNPPKGWREVDAGGGGGDDDNGGGGGGSVPILW